MLAQGWAVVICNRSITSDQLAENLRKAGHRSYCPMYRKLLKGVRIVDGRRVRTRGEGEVVQRPLFGRYSLVEVWPDTLAAILHFRGVERILMWSDNTPKLASEEELDIVRADVNSGRWDEVGGEKSGAHDALRKALDAGEHPRVKVPEWADKLATVTKLGEAGAAWVILDEAFGRRAVPAKVSAATLELVAG